MMVVAPTETAIVGFVGVSFPSCDAGEIVRRQWQVPSTMTSTTWGRTRPT